MCASRGLIATSTAKPPRRPGIFSRLRQGVLLGALCAAPGLLAASVLFGLSSPAHAQGRAGSETEEDVLFKKAEEEFNAGDYAGAAELYDQVIKINPTRVEAFVKRATLHFRERDYGKAIELLTRAEKLSVSDLTIKTVLGLCFYESGQRDRGLSYLEDVVRQRAESYEAQFQIGKHYARIEPGRAITALEQYFRYRPDDQKGLDPLAQHHLGTAYFLRGQIAEAAKLLQQAHESRPRDHQIRQMLGTVYIAQRRWAEGAELYESYQGEIDRRPAVAFNLATCYLNLGRRDDARKLAQKYQQLRPSDPRALLLLAAIDRGSDKEADLRAALSKYEQAQEALRSASPTLETRSRVNVRVAMARTYLQLKDTQRAVGLLEPALNDAKSKSESGEGSRGDSSREEAELLAAMIDSRLQQMVQAKVLPGSAQVPAGLLPLAERLAELASGDAPALTLAGSAAYAAGNFEKARRFYSEARTADDKLQRARIGLSRTLEQLALAEVARVEDSAPRVAEKSTKKDQPAPPPATSEARTAGLASALTLLREAQRLDDNPSVTRNLAAVYLLQGNAAESEKLLLAPTFNRGDVTALRLRARAQQQLGKSAAAQESAERAVSEARKQLENLPSAEGNRRPLLAQRLAEAQIELATRFLTESKDSRERLERAVELLEQANKELGSIPDAPTLKETQRAAQRDLAVAHLRRGRFRLAEAESQIGKNGVTAATTKLAEDALADLQQALDSNRLESQAPSRETGQALCLAALAAAQANQPKAARDFVGRATSAGCELVSPYNRLGTELISVFASYRGTNAPAQREQLLRSLPRLQSRAGNAPDAATLQRVLRALLYSTNMALAYDYYVTGRGKQVGPTLRAAQKTAPRSDEEDAVLQHNLAIVDLNEGRSVGEKTLERLGQNPPEALVNLGILQDRRGQPRKALELYRRAFERGARTPKLREWIDTKDRLLGGSAQ